jgi:hypothetical protein
MTKEESKTFLEPLLPVYLRERDNFEIWDILRYFHREAYFKRIHGSKYLNRTDVLQLLLQEECFQRSLFIYRSVSALVCM